MRDFLNRYRELIITAVLLVVTLVIWLSYAKQGRDLNALDRAALFVTSPVSRVVNGSADFIIGKKAKFKDAEALWKENGELRRQIFQLQEVAAQVGELKAENQRLRDNIGLKEQSSATLLAARVIGEGISRNSLTLVIDRGSMDGVRNGMAVISRQGVVGRIAAVGSASSSLLMMSDLNSSIPIRVQRSRARAIVKGQGSGRNFVVERLDRTVEVENGDLLVTSGTDGVFPKGIPVGVVTDLERPDFGMFLKAMATPAVDLTCPDSTLEELFVVTALSPEDARDQDAEDGAQK